MSCTIACAPRSKHAECVGSGMPLSRTEVDLAGKPSERFSEVYNFRNLQSRSSLLQDKGVNIYRSALLKYALDSDCKLFVEKYGIQTVVNLRGKKHNEESKLTDGADRILNYYPDEEGEPKQNGGRRLIRFDLFTEQTKASVKKLILCWRFAPLILLAAWVYVFGGFLKVLTCGCFRVPVEQMQAYLYSVAFNQLIASTMFDPMSNGGPMGTLYVMMLQNSQDILFEVLQVIAEPANRPAIFHCTSGKDRTGLIAMLLLGAVGDVSSEQIVQDYCQSNAWALSSRHARLAFGTKTHYLSAYTHEQMAAPETAIRAALRFLDDTYGGIIPYLDHIGFGASWREKLLLPDKGGVAKGSTDHNGYFDGAGGELKQILRLRRRKSETRTSVFTSTESSDK